MQTIRFGRTGLTVGRTGFGAIPIQRISSAEAERILRRAVEGGVNLIDTARGYTDSEEKIGRALSPVRDQVILATKSSGAADRDGVLSLLERSLRNLRTDCVDILQLHNPVDLPDPDDASGPYAGLVEAKKQGKIRFLGLTSHRVKNALLAAESGLYDVIQFPLSTISSKEDLGVIEACRRSDLGLLAMKAMCGGILTSAAPAFAFLRQYENVVPIWGIQTLAEIEEFLALEAAPPRLDEAMWAVIHKDRQELADQFCRACGYCLPCPADVPIPMAARMSLLLRRMPYQQFLTDDWRQKMGRILDCKKCGHCTENCPYGLDTPALLRRMYDDYEAFRQSKAGPA